MNLEERKAFLYELDGRGYTFANTKWLGGCFEDDMLNMAWEMWQASANREGFVLVPKEPTLKMVRAAEHIKSSNTIRQDIYKAMIEAWEQKG